MKIYTLTLDNPKGKIQQKHFSDRAPFKKFTFVNGVDAKLFGLGVDHTYDFGEKFRQSSLGCVLSHWMIWTMLEILHIHEDLSEPIMITEDDAEFLPGAMDAIDAAIKDLPKDWDMLFPGSCCAVERIRATIREGLYECWPLCTHCYIVQPKAFKTLIQTNHAMSAPIDIQMLNNSFPKLKVFAILPRVVDQIDLELAI